MFTDRSTRRGSQESWKQTGERQAGSRAPTARQREGRGQSHRLAEGHALGPAGAQRPWVPVHGQARWRQPSEAIMRMAAVSSMDPVPACAFSPRVEQSWVKGQDGGFGLQLSILPSSLQRRHYYLWASRGRRPKSSTPHPQWGSSWPTRPWHFHLLPFQRTELSLTSYVGSSF